MAQAAPLIQTSSPEGQRLPKRLAISTDCPDGSEPTEPPTMDDPPTGTGEQNGDGPPATEAVDSTQPPDQPDEAQKAQPGSPRLVTETRSYSAAVAPAAVTVLRTIAHPTDLTEMSSDDRQARCAALLTELTGWTEITMQINPSAHENAPTNEEAKTSDLGPWLVDYVRRFSPVLVEKAAAIPAETEVLNHALAALNSNATRISVRYIQPLQKEGTYLVAVRGPKNALELAFRILNKQQAKAVIRARISAPRKTVLTIRSPIITQSMSSEHAFAVAHQAISKFTYKQPGSTSPLIALDSDHPIELIAEESTSSGDPRIRVHILQPPGVHVTPVQRHADGEIVLRCAHAGQHVCRHCDNPNHATKDCPTPLCLECLQNGHTRKNCPVLAARQQLRKTSSVICFTCEQSGHTARLCPQSNRSKHKESGHTARHCQTTLTTEAAPKAKPTKTRSRRAKHPKKGGTTRPNTSTTTAPIAPASTPTKTTTAAVRSSRPAPTLNDHILQKVPNTTDPETPAPTTPSTTHDSTDTPAAPHTNPDSTDASAAPCTSPDLPPGVDDKMAAEDAEATAQLSPVDRNFPPLVTTRPDPPASPGAAGRAGC